MLIFPAAAFFCQVFNLDEKNGAIYVQHRDMCMVSVLSLTEHGGICAWPTYQSWSIFLHRNISSFVGPLLFGNKGVRGSR